MLKPKAGDLVRFKPMKVKTFDNEDCSVEIVSKQFGPWWVSADEIEEILPRSLAVGARVRHRIAIACQGKIVALVKSEAYVDWDIGIYASKPPLETRVNVHELCLSEP